jgi:hypothetical protein
LAGGARRPDFWIASLSVRTETSFVTMVCWQRLDGEVYKVIGSSRSVATLAETPSVAEKAVHDALDAMRLGTSGPAPGGGRAVREGWSRAGGPSRGRQPGRGSPRGRA